MSMIDNIIPVSIALVSTAKPEIPCKDYEDDPTYCESDADCNGGTCILDEKNCRCDVSTSTVITTGKFLSKDYHYYINFINHQILRYDP